MGGTLGEMKWVRSRGKYTQGSKWHLATESEPTITDPRNIVYSRQHCKTIDGYAVSTYSGGIQFSDTIPTKGGICAKCLTYLYSVAT
jgi:hypothetical protein